MQFNSIVGGRGQVLSVSKYSAMAATASLMALSQAQLSFSSCLAHFFKPFSSCMFISTGSIKLLSF